MFFNLKIEVINFSTLTSENFSQKTIFSELEVRVSVGVTFPNSMEAYIKSL